jgi:hypothetical protein
MLGMATPKKKRRRQRIRGGYSINVWVSNEHGAAFEALLSRNRRTKTAELELMIEKVCAAEGLWPPPAEGGDA